jgi:hypothetical protein
VTDKPVSIMRGKSRIGFWHSSAMLTESSNPTIAKNASVVAAVRARKALFSSGLEKIITREKSARPWDMPHRPTKITSSRPESSTIVRTTLALTLSPTPRKFTTATSAMNPSAMATRPPLPASSPRPNPSLRKPANAFDAVEADVMPELMTMNAMMKVRKWMPNALCV